MAEIVARAGKIRAARLERFARAAREHLALVRKDQTRFARPTPKPDARPKRDKPEPAPAPRRVMFLEKLESITAELLRYELAGGVTEEELDELRMLAHARIEEQFAEATIETPDPDQISLSSVSSEPEKCPPACEIAPEFGRQICLPKDTRTGVLGNGPD